MQNNKKDIPTLNYIPNGYLVFLILIPILGKFFFEPLIVLFFQNIFNFNPESIMNAWILWMIFYASLNGFISDLDSKALKKSNINIKRAIFWGVIFVPVYIYIRGSTLNKIYNLGGLKSQWAFLTWILVFIVSIII